jgi:hypothetical protein
MSSSLKRDVKNNPELVATFFAYFEDDIYNEGIDPNLDEEDESELEDWQKELNEEIRRLTPEVRQLTSICNNLHTYYENMELYKYYMKLLKIKWGGPYKKFRKQIFKSKRKQGIIKDFIPIKPKLGSKKLKRLKKEGYVPPPREVKVEYTRPTINEVEESIKRTKEYRKKYNEYAEQYFKETGCEFSWHPVEYGKKRMKRVAKDLMDIAYEKFGNVKFCLKPKKDHIEYVRKEIRIKDIKKAKKKNKKYVPYNAANVADINRNPEYHDTFYEGYDGIDLFNKMMNVSASDMYKMGKDERYEGEVHLQDNRLSDYLGKTEEEIDEMLEKRHELFVDYLNGFSPQKRKERKEWKRIRDLEDKIRTMLENDNPLEHIQRMLKCPMSDIKHIYNQMKNKSIISSIQNERIRVDEYGHRIRYGPVFGYVDTMSGVTFDYVEPIIINI